MKSDTATGTKAGISTYPASEAVQRLRECDIAAFQTPDGLLVLQREYAAETDAAIADQDLYCEMPMLIPIIRGRVERIPIVWLIGGS